MSEKDKQMLFTNHEPSLFLNDTINIHKEYRDKISINSPENIHQKEKLYLIDCQQTTILLLFPKCRAISGEK